MRDAVRPLEQLAAGGFETHSEAAVAMHGEQYTNKDEKAWQTAGVPCRSALV
jgi:hypothetical protein